MKKYYILFIFTVICFLCYSQNGIHIIDYFPAPGQHINTEYLGTPAAAQKMTESLSSMVSLGSFGGYIVLEFENACVNDPGNPYGIDFTVFGNAFPGSSEPGVIWVMKDENKNGIADDTWYEIAGSKYFHSGTVKNYEVTYFRTESRDVYWEDNLDNSGWIRANSYHTQKYYPLADYFPQFPQDSVKFRGTRLQAAVDSSDINQIKMIPPAFGYADCHSRKQGINLTLPDNPYTAETEGAGGNPVDISWAVDSLGNYIDIDSVHFVKIVTGNMASVGWIGEISTDVAWMEDVDSRPGITGKEEMLVIYPYPERILAGDTLQLEVSYFDEGRKQPMSILFSSDNEQVLSADSSGKFVANNTGEAEIIVSAGEEVRSATIKVVVPDSIEIIESEPPVVCSSGNNAVIISGRLTMFRASESIPEFEMYPNPVSYELTVKCMDNSEYHLFMYDINGRIIYENIITDHMHKIDVSMLKAGIYHLVLVSEGRSVTGKIIKK